MSNFDPALFLDLTVDVPMVKREPLPASEYQAVITDVAARQWTGKSDPTKSGVALDVKLDLEIPQELQDKLPCGPTLKNQDSIMLDTTPTGSLDFTPGKNNQLRKYREALDMNKAGEPFSPRQMVGKIIRVVIKHDLYQGEIQERVSGVTKA